MCNADAAYRSLFSASIAIRDFTSANSSSWNGCHIVSLALFRTSMGIIPRDPEGLGGGDSTVLVI
jgi:hypothetical protein